ncbi:sugar nucleotide-binding protein [Planomonospora sp. ID91781]|uniref:dTDP-4-dehydrorhamnose reductase n=1 Tax=Planomonospora sphaerica TaxID=161355 RepID=A0A161LUD4_9ACTN|nr:MULTISPECIES: sugar nucleotide-binding protein [Planomonospora]MBG0820936.1 sugar nucleotide-binding protein [Planomonospora sp. ID91781]GAT65151.1 dTDP-4-dehydrorhamnose reductase [Planomonospora sphaerica]
MRFLIVGGSGLLGGELVRRCSAAGHEVAATYLTRPGETAGVEWSPLDVRRREDVGALIGAFRPEAVVNAAYRQADWTTTAVGAANVALAVSAAGGRLVHVSSDAVFSGAAIRYDETCVPDPITPYGAAKAAAETAVTAIAPTAVIARTSLIIGDGGSPHEALVHSLATGRERGVLFTDDVRCPVHVADLATALLELAASGHHGVHHVAGADAVSRYELGLLIARRDGLDVDRLPSGRRADSGVPGPLDVRLECGTTRRRLRTELRGARRFLR